MAALLSPAKTLGASQLQICECTGNEVSHDAGIVEDPLELGCCLLSLACLQRGLPTNVDRVGQR